MVDLTTILALSLMVIVAAAAFRKELYALVKPVWSSTTAAPATKCDHDLEHIAQLRHMMDFYREDAKVLEILKSAGVAILSQEIPQDG